MLFNPLPWALSRGIAWVGRAGGTRWRCGADTPGRIGSDPHAAPAPGRHAGPGRPGAPPGGHYGPPARSWLTASHKRDAKAWPGTERKQAFARTASGAPRGAPSRSQGKAACRRRSRKPSAVCRAARRPLRELTPSSRVCRRSASPFSGRRGGDAQKPGREQRRGKDDGCLHT